MGLLVEDWYIGVRHGLCFRRFSQVVLLFPRTRLLQDSQSLDFPAAYQFHTTISDSLLPFRYPVVTHTGNPFPIAPVSSKFAALLVVQARLPTPDAPILRPSHRIANTSGDIWSKSWLLGSLDAFQSHDLSSHLITYRFRLFVSTNRQHSRSSSSCRTSEIHVPPFITIPIKLRLNGRC
ncbi:hypothetical protein D6C95_02532 [Aureobasidium pullulans]|nr:hypothetical protein D6C95_02532 [Aureobasidium pullulans]